MVKINTFFSEEKTIAQVSPDAKPQEVSYEGKYQAVSYEGKYQAVSSDGKYQAVSSDGCAQVSAEDSDGYSVTSDTSEGYTHVNSEGYTHVNSEGYTHVNSESESEKLPEILQQSEAIGKVKLLALWKTLVNQDGQIVDLEEELTHARKTIAQLRKMLEESRRADKKKNRWSSLIGNFDFNF